MDPPPSPPSSPIDFNNDFLDETANFDFDFDFDTCNFMDSLFSPTGTAMPHGNNESSSISPPIPPSDRIDPHLSLNTHIPTSTHAVSVDNFCSGLADPVAMEDQIQVGQSFQGNSKELDASQAHPINYQSIPVHQPNLLMSSMEQLPPLPHFAGQTAAVGCRPSSYGVIEGQLPREEYTPPPKSFTVSSADNFVSTMDDILSRDPEGIACFLAGIVRPGPGCCIYKCSTCSVEFPNAQALGGHMKTHAKRKAEEEGDGKGKGKRMRRTKAPKKKSCESEEDD